MTWMTRESRMNAKVYIIYSPSLAVAHFVSMQKKLENIKVEINNHVALNKENFGPKEFIN